MTAFAGARADSHLHTSIRTRSLARSLAPALPSPQKHVRQQGDEHQEQSRIHPCPRGLPLISFENANTEYLRFGFTLRTPFVAILPRIFAIPPPARDATRYALPVEHAAERHSSEESWP